MFERIYDSENFMNLKKAGMKRVQKRGKSAIIDAMELCEKKSKALDVLPESVFLFDGNLNVLYCNYAFENRFGSKCGKFSAVGEGINCWNYLNSGCCGQGDDCARCEFFDILSKCVKECREVDRVTTVKTLVTHFGREDVSLQLSVRPVEDGCFLCMIGQAVETDREIEEAKKQHTKLIKDLAKAKSIQSSFLPDKNPLRNLCDFTYFYRQEFQVGGDFFDVYPIDDHTYGCYIADVSGAGMSGGMLTVFLRDNFDRKLKSPALALSLLSHKFNELKIAEESYITIFSIVVNRKRNRLAYCNAGHNQPMFYRKGDGRVLSCFTEGKPVCNWYEDSDYEDSYIDFEPGDTLALFTDGISDLTNTKGRVYGEERIRLLMERNLDIYQTLREAQHSLLTFNHGKSQMSDDLTLLLLENLK